MKCLTTIVITSTMVNGTTSISKKHTYVFFVVFTQKRPREKTLHASVGVHVTKTYLQWAMVTTNSNAKEEEELFVSTPSKTLNGLSIISQLKRELCVLISTKHTQLC